MSPSPVRVILADDHTLVRAGIRRIVESQSGYIVVGEAADGDEAADVIRRVPADLMILDLKMSGRDGIEVLRVAREEVPNLKVIVLTMHAGREYVARTLEEGASGYLLKDSAVQDLAAAMSTVSNGGRYFSPAIQAQMAEILQGGREESTDVSSLTEREREVLSMLARGLTTKEIATSLGIGTRTVETHRANLMRKLNLRSVAMLTQLAIREGMVDLPNS
jgi:DNA-binding NarL/FixJ family response regulator